MDATFYLTFVCQQYRRFTIALSFVDGHSAILVTDCGCLPAIDLTGCIQNDLSFLSVLAFLIFGSPADIGLDPHCEVDPLTGRITVINCDNRRFEIAFTLSGL